MISSRLTWTKALQTLASQATKALALFRRFDYYVNGVNPKTALIVFDKAILVVLLLYGVVVCCCCCMVLLYGSEIWGHTVAEPVEKVQITFCKFILGVGKTANNVAILGEVGKLPMFIQYQKRCVKYWLKLIEMDQNRSPLACYKMLKDLDDQGRRTWATDIRNMLYRYGFGHVWMNQGVGDTTAFINAFFIKG